MSDAASHSAGWRPATYYPDPAILALDPRFEKYWLKPPAVERLYTGCRWAEGPVWFGDMRSLLWSDIPNNASSNGTRRPARSASSASRRTTPTATPATGGRLVTCEHGGRQVTRTEHDGTITV